MKRILGTLITTAMLIGFAAPAFAATDGDLGTTSTGTAVVSVTVPELIRVTGLSDFAFGTWDGVNNLTDNDDVCIYTNKAAATYRVTGSGSGTASAFTITDGSNTIAYTVYYNDASGTSGQAQMTATTALTAQSGANTSSQDCSSHASDNANIEVRISNTALLAAPSGSYTGTLTIVADPT